MNTPDLEEYHKIKHKLQELIETQRNSEKGIQMANAANSQLITIETHINRIFSMTIQDATTQLYCIKNMLESTTDSSIKEQE